MKYITASAQHLLDLIYPPRCPVCHEIIRGQEQRACRVCRGRLQYQKEPKCKKCGKEITNQEKEYCFDCTAKVHYYDRGISVFKYDDAMRESVYKFKYAGKKEYAGFYIEEMVNYAAEQLEAWAPDIIIPVPLHKERKRSRGFNQAELLAKGIGRKTGIPVDSQIIRRVRNTSPQKNLGNKERKENLKDSFQITAEPISWKRILIIDDIYTTGSTIDGIARLLKKKGAEKVYFLVLSSAEGA